MPVCPRDWNTLTIHGGRPEQRARLRIVWANSAQGVLTDHDSPETRELVFANGRWLGVPNVYGPQCFRVVDEGRDLCLGSVFKYAAWETLDYELTLNDASSQGCKWTVRGPNRWGPAESLLGRLPPAVSAEIVTE